MPKNPAAGTAGWMAAIGFAMRRARTGWNAALAPFLLTLAGDAGAFNYQLVANAGADGESTIDVGISSVSAQDRNPDDDTAPTYEFYSASAGGSGSLNASASSAGVPPFAAISHGA